MIFKKLILTILVIVGMLISFKIYNMNTDSSCSLGNEAIIANDNANRLQTSEDNEQVKTIEVFTHQSLTEEIREQITGVSYKTNDVIKLEDLSYLQVMYWGFDNKEHIGQLIVHEKVSAEVTEIFKELYNAKFPIEKIKLIDEYGADDNLSMEDNNTSAFCFREVTGNKDKLSKHSYGLAIDINPVQNPYIYGDIILPSNGREYVDRTDLRKGMIQKGDTCYKAFIKKGWTWGGEWRSLKDYQHFERVIDLQ